MSSVPEYNLRELGPWERDGETLCALVCTRPRFSRTHGLVVEQPQRQVYYDCGGRPIYFAGTDPRYPGRPPPDDEEAVGHPLDQWQTAFQRHDPSGYYVWLQTGQWHE